MKMLMSTLVICLIGLVLANVDLNLSKISVPIAGMLFATTLVSLGVMGRRKKKNVKTNTVSVFAARTS